MSHQTVAGSEIYICSALPADQLPATFAALAWVKIGEITDMGSVIGRAYNTSSHSPIDSAQVVEKKGSYRLEPAEFQCAWDDDDAGQNDVEDASKTNDVVSFKVKKQDGAIRYFTAQVSKFVENMGTVDNVVTGAFTLLRQTDTVKVAAP
jgi:hypothetical protein